MKRYILILIIIIFMFIIQVPLLFAWQLRGLPYNSNVNMNGFFKSTLNPEPLKKEKTGNKDNKNKKFMFVIFGTYNFGQVTYYPYTPVTGDPSSYTYAFGPNPAKQYDLSYGFGLGIDYRLFEFLSFFIDGGMNSWKLLLAQKNGYAYGQWVAEATNWNSAVVGTFSMDNYYYMDTTVARLGVRCIFSQGKLQPWAGVGVGLYAWQATVGNRKEGLKIGTQDSGLSFGYSVITGMDFVVSDMTLRVFLDYGSAIAYPKISKLLDDPYSSAVFENTGGEQVTGPYKVGCAVGFKY